VALPENIDPALKQAMDNSLKAYEAGDKKFFDYLSDDVRVYGIDASEPLIGRKAFEDNFEATFIKTKRVATPTFQDIRIAGKQAVLSQILQVTTEDVSLPIRQTVVWDGAGSKWLMTHIHNGRAGQTVSVGKAPTTAAGIRVLNERIATVAAVVGVAQ
jgi:ketosteroid isomerase-like protein